MFSDKTNSWISFKDLIKEVSILISPLVIYWPNIKNIVLTSSSLLSFIWVNWTLPTNFFIWFLHVSLDFFVCSKPNQFFLNIFERSDQGSIQLERSCTNQILRTLFSRCRRFWASYGWTGRFQPSRSMDVDTQYRLPSLCLCGWVNCWYGLVDHSTHKMWHHFKHWTNLVTASLVSWSMIEVFRII